MKTEKGSLAYCSKNKLGLITSDRKVEVNYLDCEDSKGLAWTGIHLTGEIGSPWASRSPLVVGKIDLTTGVIRLKFDGDPKFLPDDSIVIRPLAPVVEVPPETSRK